VIFLLSLATDALFTGTIPFAEDKKKEFCSPYIDNEMVIYVWERKLCLVPG